MNRESLGVFLTCGPSDASRRQILDAALRQAGARTALDETREIENGLPSEPVLQDLDACTVLLVLWSQITAKDPVVAVHRQLAESFGKEILVVGETGPGTEASEVVEKIFHGRPVPRPAPPPRIAIGPGDWRIESTATPRQAMTLTMADGGEVTGRREHGALAGDVTGRWTFDDRDQYLDLRLDSAFGLKPVHSHLELRLIEDDGRRILAEDLHGIANQHSYTITGL